MTELDILAAKFWSTPFEEFRDLGTRFFDLALIGQLVSLHLARRVAVLPRIQLAGLYAIGTISTYWLIERLIVL